MAKEKAPSRLADTLSIRPGSRHERSMDSRRFIEVQASGGEKHTEMHASPLSERVIKKSSVTHRDALKRLVDR